MANEMVTVYIPEALRRSLRLEAARRGVSQSSIVTEAIRTTLLRRDVDAHNAKSRTRKKGK